MRHDVLVLDEMQMKGHLANITYPCETAENLAAAGVWKEVHRCQREFMEKGYEPTLDAFVWDVGSKKRRPSLHPWKYGNVLEALLS